MGCPDKRFLCLMLGGNAALLIALGLVLVVILVPTIRVEEGPGVLLLLLSWLSCLVAINLHVDAWCNCCCCRDATTDEEKACIVRPNGMFVVGPDELESL